VPMPATTLLLRLAACGINLSPRDSDALSLERITPKEASVELELHDSLAPLLPRYQLAPSRWNLSRGPAKCTVRLNAVDSDPADEEKPPPADPYATVGDWQTLEVAYRRVLLINALDSDATCDDAPQEGMVSHSSPLECLKHKDPDVLDVLHSSSRLYQDTARQLLNSLRLFSFTQEPAS